jgi:hypothetical protein
MQIMLYETSPEAEPGGCRVAELAVRETLENPGHLRDNSL